MQFYIVKRYLANVTVVNKKITYKTTKTKQNVELLKYVWEKCRP